MIVVIIQIL